MKNKILAFLFGPKGADVREVSVGFASTTDPVFDGPPFKAMPPPYDNPPPIDNEFVEPGCELFDTYPTRQVQDLEDGREFIWETNDGEELNLSEMATPHLFYTLRMIFNHSVPPAFRVGEFRRRKNVDLWPLDYRQQAGQQIRATLRDRDDLEPWMDGEIKDMRANAAYLDETAPVVRYNIDDVVNSEKLSELVRLYHEKPTSKDIRKKLEKLGLDADHYIPTSGERPVVTARRVKSRAKRMRRARETLLSGFPGKRCMEHRSYAGIRKPRVDCNACRQVYRARRRKRKNF